MLEMAIVLSLCALLIAISYEYTSIIKREWGENSKSFF